MINNKLVVGYIGNGKSANRYHLPFITQRRISLLSRVFLIFI